jgi:cytochrome c biogenesis protein CcmG/thiol:disulfide interchange protein DsbE
MSELGDPAVDNAAAPGPVPPPRPRSRFMAWLPLIAFALLAALFAKQLLFGGDTSRIPSALIGKPAPMSDLPPLEGMNVPGMPAAALREGHVTLVNIFASWCVPCRAEHGFLMQLAADAGLKAKGVRIAGISYKDDAEQAKGFLARGNPYAAIGVDRAGRAAIDWGVYGVPETFIVRGDGTIAYKLIGEISEKNMREILLPQIEKALQ